MIDQIIVKDFQSLHNVTVEPGKFSVILGESDVGKSAFIRAVKAAVDNETGQGFIRNGTKQTSVTLGMHELLCDWKKGASAVYTVTDGGRDRDDGEPGVWSQKFEKVKGVPDLVRDSLRLGEVECGDVKITPNFHTQFDSPFLVADTSSVRAKVLGELSGINLLFLATQEARRREAAAKKEAALRASQLDDQTSQLRTYDDVESVAEILQSARNILARIEVYTAEIQSLTWLAEHIANDARGLLNLTIRVGDVINAIKEFDDLGLSDDDLDNLRDTINNIGVCEANMANFRTEILRLEKEIENIDEQLSLVQYCPTCGRLMEDV